MKQFDTYIVNPEIESYISDLSPAYDPLVEEMEKLAEQLDFPIIGSQVGRFLYQITKISGAKKIFELGSGFGYSAYWFSKALDDGGYIICTEHSADNHKIAEELFKKSDYFNRVKYKKGEALSILKRQEEKFDIILNDVDKEYYPDVVELAAEKLSPGGLLITDNMLWFGRVLSEDNSPSTVGVKKFTELLFSRKDFMTTIIPIRDGISISLKI
ncbi:MAG: O-methyltransferase [Candidatus Dadabacteria bacterium]|nr:O-methyltransferase [Candidatus Dadabacteria bacterium]NIS08062.1 O-methyltransferase [Candidatus Dadabacteria bacterium]NIV42310.1 O-methyltransferase [Candidatus Dadabacteria bacterium]NIX14805.1 O-methyltransferase [Candidatus Dadabacteria bacterium]NIY21346.1 O-methyltransferase [Candidatus Dadabacteria bacterium]